MNIREIWTDHKQQMVSVGANVLFIVLLYLALTQGRRGNAAFDPNSHVGPHAIGKLHMEIDPLNNPGKFYDFDRVPIVLKPIQKPFPELWYGTSRPDSIPWAAENGAHIVTLRDTTQARAIIEPSVTSIDYVEIRDADSLGPAPDDIGPRAALVVACRVGTTRLIDNVVLGEDPPPLEAPPA